MVYLADWGGKGGLPDAILRTHVFVGFFKAM